MASEEVNPYNSKEKMPLSLQLSYKVIAITGGYGYLGRAIVESLLVNGAKVYVLGRSEEAFEQTFDKLENLSFIRCDVSKTTDIRFALKQIIEKEGTLSTLINNAFYIKGQSPELLSDEEFSFGLDGTLSNVFRCIREIIPYFKQQKSGVIINVSSMYGMVSPDFSVYEQSPEFLNPPHYGAAKAGVIQLTRYYANYLGKWNIRVNAVTPGPYPSKEVQKDVQFIQKLSEKTSLGRIGQPEDLAGAFTFLASDAARFITGQNLVVDGGWTSR